MSPISPLLPGGTLYPVPVILKHCHEIRTRMEQVPTCTHYFFEIFLHTTIYDQNACKKYLQLE